MGDWLLPAVLLGGIALWAYKEQSAGDNLVFAPGPVTGISFVNGTPVIDLTVLVQNTSNTDLMLNSLALNIFSNDIYIGNVSGFQPVGIVANQQTTVPVQATLQPLSLVNDIIRAFQTKSATQNLEAKGAANVSSFQVPIDLKFSVG